MKSDNIKNELSEIAPELSTIPKKESYTAPKGYFESVPDDTWNKIKSSQTGTKTIDMSFYKKIAGIAASLLVLFVCVQLFNQNDSLAEEILVEDMVDYMIENIDDVDSEELFDLYDITDNLDDIDLYEYLEEDDLQDIDEQFLESLY